MWGAFVKRHPEPKYALDVHRGLAGALEMAEDLDGAEASYDYVWANGDEDPEWMNGYAWFLATHGRKLEKALEVARRAVELSPKAPHILDTLAECHFRLGQFEDAVARQREAVALLETPEARGPYEERRKAMEAAAAKRAADRASP